MFEHMAGDEIAVHILLSLASVGANGRQAIHHDGTIRDGTELQCANQWSVGMSRASSRAALDAGPCGLRD